MVICFSLQDGGSYDGSEGIKEGKLFCGFLTHRTYSSRANHIDHELLLMMSYC